MSWDIPFGRTHRYEEANNRYSEFVCESAWKRKKFESPKMTFRPQGAIPFPDFSGLREKRIVPQVVKIFLLSLYGKWMFCTVSTKARHFSLAWTRRIHSTLFIEIRLKIILPYVCYKWSPSLRFPYQNSVFIYFFSLRATCPALLLSSVIGLLDILKLKLVCQNFGLYIYVYTVVEYHFYLWNC
jgi:hypothetical protein